MKVCIEAGCPNLTDATRCDEHQRARQNTTRKQYSRGNYGSEWPTISKRYRRRHPICECTNPACSVCHGSCTKPSTEVDHVIPLRHFTTRRAAHDDDNLAALCHRCHAFKTAHEVFHDH